MACSENTESPPTLNFDFDVARIGEHTLYVTAFGTPCQYMNLLPEDAFITPSGSEETELSSDESSASKGSSIRSIPTASTASNIKKVIKQEKLSDSGEISKSKDSTKSKTKSKGIRRSSPKSKKWSGVEYSESDSDEDRHKSRRKKYSNDSDEERSKFRRKKESSTKSVKTEETEEKESKYTPGLTAAFGNYHCQVCDITVNSEVTYQTHLQGKRHQKALKAKAVPEVAIQSLHEPLLPPTLVGSLIAPSRKPRRIVLQEESLIQRVAEDYKEGPLPGLSDVVEIRTPFDEIKDITYLCNLCEAQCVPNSIMKHLTGFKHYLRCLEIFDEKSYEKFRYSSKKAIESKVKRILLDYERRRGRGVIRVEQEVDDQCSLRGDAGPSWRDGASVASFAPSADGSDDAAFVSAIEHLDTSMSDFYCKACDAHMNNKAMWESHVRGKRHLKNIKKVPGESTSKIKSIHCPGEIPHLLRLLDELEGDDEYGNPFLIVGLDYIKETQGEAGDLYNCFICGACTSSYDIIEHLLQSKHKTKYLETMNAKGYPNSIENIKCLSDVSVYSKECMINEECRTALEKYGEGKVLVYKSKNMYAPSTYSGHSSRY